MCAMSDSSSAWRFSSNQSNTNAPHPEVRLEDTMANDPWSIWRPELSKETHVSVLPPNPIPQTSPPAELPRQGLSIPMILEYTKGEGSILLEISGREVLVPLDKKTGMNEAQKKRHRNAEASARSRKKRALKMEIIKKLEEARRLRESKEKDEEPREKKEELREKDEEPREKKEELREKDEEPREIKEETQTIEREIAKKLELLEDEELEKKHLAQLEDKAVPEEMSYAPDATLLGATYDPIFNPFLTPDYYLTGDHCATDPTELYWDCIQSLYTEYE